jgi:hypothetical protein
MDGRFGTPQEMATPFQGSISLLKGSRLFVNHKPM